MLKAKSLLDNQKTNIQNGTLSYYYLASTGAVVLWSASFIATKLAYETFAPIQLVAVRTLFAVILFWFMRKITSNNEQIQKEDRMRIALSGFLGITLYFAIENIGVSMTSSSNSALIVASFPAVTTLLEFFIYHSKPNVKKVLGIILAIIGVAVLTQINVDGNSKSMLGNIILIGAGIVWAFYNFITRDLTNKYSAMTLTYYQMLAGFIFFLPFVIIEGKTWRMPTMTSASALIYLSVGCSIVAFLLYNLGLRKLSASISVSLMNLVPVLGLIFSILILHESVSTVQILGGVIVIIGVILSSIQKG
ncbi:DMT family transporter [Clostridium beijerinckii]|jgi:drug/metabolite transporter (DMT)-like permease|uniref:DMT family transporter n=1 Tax=Clostridium beijerinckii TaxID=1520 RepID=UPI0014940783|nr:DMT family transporter [Clostridium beijerinckii]MCI1580890.1 DMT family transporter [Clostridium beijerinckii]MCI1584163.1 DMT family transporter [Clostridium beijerinckii]MCI1624270.1 DMT family transporter [Clostridium beijerinckii]NOV59745.1 drug/metabolite transporter (DMT)-like permease [Clostridium beijerinckii]NOV71471.1 drug/metabolite transporter (DMT)-like permease [Clostridium beijerinckii]